jgi:hypothetical protein
MGSPHGNVRAISHRTSLRGPRRMRDVCQWARLRTSVARAGAHSPVENACVHLRDGCSRKFRRGRQVGDQWRFHWVEQHCSQPERLHVNLFHLAHKMRRGRTPRLLPRKPRPRIFLRMLRRRNVAPRNVRVERVTGLVCPDFPSRGSVARRRNSTDRRFRQRPESVLRLRTGSAASRKRLCRGSTESFLASALICIDAGP